MNTQNLTGGQVKEVLLVIFLGRVDKALHTTAYKGMRDSMNKVNDNNHNVDLYNEFNPKFNDYAKQINDYNREYNAVKDVKKQTYDDAIQISNQTKGADYTDQRDKIRLIKKLEEAGISAEDSQKDIRRCRICI